MAVVRNPSLLLVIVWYATKTVFELQLLLVAMQITMQCNNNSYLRAQLQQICQAIKMATRVLPQQEEGRSLLANL